MQSTRAWMLGAFCGIAIVLGWQVLGRSQQPPVDKTKDLKEATNRFEFEVVHSFDAKYLGDTPGHMGRSGGLGTRRPKIALGDRVYRGEEQIGIVTQLDWNRTNNALDVEFDPVGHARVCVGDMVWVVLDNPSPRRTIEPQPTK